MELRRADTFEVLTELTFPEPQWVTRLAFSPDSRQLAGGTSNGRIILWDLPALRQSLAAVNLDWLDPPAQLRGSATAGD